MASGDTQKALPGSDTMEKVVCVSEVVKGTFIHLRWNYGQQVWEQDRNR